MLSGSYIYTGSWRTAVGNSSGTPSPTSHRSDDSAAEDSKSTNRRRLTRVYLRWSFNSASPTLIMPVEKWKYGCERRLSAAKKNLISEIYWGSTSKEARLGAFNICKKRSRVIDHLAADIATGWLFARKLIYRSQLSHKYRVVELLQRRVSVERRLHFLDQISCQI